MERHGFSFKVIGKVQGVFFRKYTHRKASQLGLAGWVCNCGDGSVAGVAEGPKADLEIFKKFLCEEGSPNSKIERCEITNYAKRTGPQRAGGFVVKDDDHCESFS
eukprot:TRINITY_DN14581_c0_g1_i1.p2 TRINITY_DN14581_c0_g1~~TRINITY_DN14581_c0_g1_i1.p2  ORF type:complete len:105 (+),score=14.75 TRINITY_DN14581_c0_g1_i1:154-468(+)